MEAKRLKNIAILILLLLNLFLLLMLGYHEMESRRVEQTALDELQKLFITEELSFSFDLDVLEESLVPLTLSRRTESESLIAAFLLGKSASAQSEGGGIFSYTAECGTIQFRSGGRFDTVRFSRPVEDVRKFVREFCEKFGYEEIDDRIVDGTGSVTAVQYVARVPILGCSITMTFENGTLVAAGGARVDLSDAQMESEDRLSCVSALVRFFDYRRDAGVVCSTIRAVRCVYQLRSGANQARLLPVWVVETDAHTYLVDGMSGEVTRR